MSTLGTRRAAESAVAGGGPSATADWVTLPGTAGGRRLRALPDAANETVHIVAAPALASLGDGVRPAAAFGMTLTLQRAPGPLEESIVPLVTGAVASMTLSVNPTNAELASAAGGRRIFPRMTRFGLARRGDQEFLATVTIDGPAGTGALSVTLSRDDAVDALGAISGLRSALVVAADLRFRAVATALPPLRVRVELARSHDRIASGLAGGAQLDDPDIGATLAALITDELVEIEGLPDDAPADPLALADLLRVDLLRALAPVLIPVRGADGITRRYRLGRRPGGGAEMVFQTRRTDGDTERTVSLDQSLTDVLRDLTIDRPLDAFVRAVSPAPDGTLQPIPTRTPTTRATADRSAEMAAVGWVAAAMPAVLRTSRGRVAAEALATSDLAIRRPGRLPGRAEAWAVNDLVVAPAAEERLESLPVIEGDGALWPDRVDGSRYWYAPELSLATPQATATADATPYLFSFAVVGHDADGRPGLEATIRLTLRAGMPAQAAAEWEAKGRPAAQAVSMNGLSVALDVPFRAEGGAQTTQQVAAIEVLTPGDVVATFSLTDRWARLAYGALSIAGFQPMPARVVVSYVFPGYVVIGQDNGRIAWGGKIAAVSRIQQLGLATRAAPATTLTAPIVGNDVAELERAVRDEDALNRTDTARNATDVAGGARRPVIAAAAHLMLQPVSPAIAVHPVIVAPVHVIAEKTYGIRTQGRTARIDTLLPCSTYGALYVQTDSSAGQEPAVVIGCRDAWTLGQVQLKLYEPVAVDTGIPTARFSVFRSLQVPGRFLVVPAAYTITRYEPGDEREYRPAIYLFSSVDAVHPERSSCVVMATLRPAITSAERRALVDALRTSAHPSATLEWPTELQVTPVYQWAVATATSAQITPAVAKTPEGFQVSLATGIDGILQLKAVLETGGVTASVAFPLADGQTPQSTLVLDLRRIDGPWEAGAVSASVAGATATIRNRVQQPADVSDVRTYAGGKRTSIATLERRLGPGESASVSVPPGTETAVSRYQLVPAPADLAEIRTFIEDVYTNVVFIATVDLAAAGLSGLGVEARIGGVPGSKSITLDGTKTSGDVGFVLPLTVYLAQPTLQYRVTAKATDGTGTAGDWHDWRLDTQGNVVEINATA